MILPHATARALACQCELLLSVTLEEFHAQLGAAEPLELERREAGDGVVDQRNSDRQVITDAVR